MVTSIAKTKIIYHPRSLAEPRLVDSILLDIGVEPGEAYQASKKYGLRLIKDCVGIRCGDVQMNVGAFWDGYLEALKAAK